MEHQETMELQVAMPHQTQFRRRPISASTARPGHLAHLAYRDQRDLPGLPDCQDPMHHQQCLVPLALQARLVHLALLALWGHLDLRDRLVK